MRDFPADTFSSKLYPAVRQSALLYVYPLYPLGYSEGRWAGGGGGDGGAFDIRGGGDVVQNRESPDFRSPEVGIS